MSSSITTPISTTSLTSMAGGLFERNADVFTSAVSLLNTSVSAYASYQSSVIKSNMMKMQARQQDLQARQERLKGVQQSNILREQLLNNLSAANALFAARGVDVGSRSATALAARNITTVGRDISLVESGAEIRRIGAEATAGTLRAAAEGERESGRAKVVKQLFGETSTRAISSLLRGI